MVVTACTATAEATPVSGSTPAGMPKLMTGQDDLCRASTHRAFWTVPSAKRRKSQTIAPSSVGRSSLPRQAIFAISPIPSSPLAVRAASSSMNPPQQSRITREAFRSSASALVASAAAEAIRCRSSGERAINARLYSVAEKTRFKAPPPTPDGWRPGSLPWKSPGS